VELSVCKEQHASEISELESRLKKETESKKEVEIRLQNDIRTLETKVEHFRAKSEELSSGRANDSNVNLLRQIEVLQAQHDIATQNWTGIEANLQTRISNLEQEAEDNSSREAYLRKKVKTLTESLKSVTNENESLNDQLDEVKSQLAKLKSSQVLLESELSDAKSTVAELESTIEKLKAEHDKKVADLDEKLKMSAESLNQNKLQQQQQQRKKSNPIDPPFFGGEPVPRSGTISPFTQRLSVDDTNTFASAAISSFKNGLSGRRTSSKASLPLLPGLTSDPSLNNGIQYAIDGLPTHFEVDDGDLMPPYSAASETFRSSSIHTRDEGSAKFDKESVSTVGAGPSIQLVNRMSRSIRSLESELSNAKQDLARTELSRDEAVKDLSELMKELEELNKYKAQVTELESKINEMSLREQTALEMLGEKSEQVQELRADVMDIKTMFQQQIEELVDRLAKAEKK
jgi:chromosome segregation ATPase